MWQYSPHVWAIFKPSFSGVVRGVRSRGLSSSSSSSLPISSSDFIYKDVETKDQPEVSKLLDDAASFSEIGNAEWATTPYPASAMTDPLAGCSKRKVESSERSIILFPGQGTIKVGDVKPYLRFPRVKELYQIASDILGYDLLKISMRGPQNVLDRTEFNQPATVVSSLAALEKLQEERPRAVESCVAVAGYSVGELTALIFTGAMPYEEGIRLVGVRAASMQAASEITSQGMLSCYCTPTAKVGSICQQAQKWAMDIGAAHPICQVAVYMYTQGKVFGGCSEALQYIEKNCRGLGLRHLKRLPVTGAFHTPLMEGALKPFTKALMDTPLGEPSAYVYSNFSASTYTNNEKLNKKYLSRQIVSPVKWEQIMHKLYERPEGTQFPRSFDMGSKGTLKTILKNINAKAADSCYAY
ncbi:probable malonyl-CoA-acyl carrier protein transacylase, mitochondrial [Copidosoma floridanum]|uniref:probable malonyl-CoA-acyl carrier protein transacylase, mitochondrial n=1 Tax=Copidosoma floridanum TaxID=29053 RepID=UPI0006C973A5|nr:probable malonyl-CoA-acyl carrier protein transacylase, mitochondrial [Copidosoma floridanum]